MSLSVLLPFRFIESVCGARDGCLGISFRFRRSLLGSGWSWASCFMRKATDAAIVVFLIGIEERFSSTMLCCPIEAGGRYVTGLVRYVIIEPWSENVLGHTPPVSYPILVVLYNMTYTLVHTACYHITENIKKKNEALKYHPPVILLRLCVYESLVLFPDLKKLWIPISSPSKMNIAYQEGPCKDLNRVAKAGGRIASNESLTADTGLSFIIAVCYRFVRLAAEKATVWVTGSSCCSSKVALAGQCCTRCVGETIDTEETLDIPLKSHNKELRIIKANIRKSRAKEDIEMGQFELGRRDPPRLKSPSSCFYSRFPIDSAANARSRPLPTADTHHSFQATVNGALVITAVFPDITRLLSPPK
ncbi:uncharacterized protein BDR25DRAFT_362999 [Lindgomyces ingoldianus]|uniref:Uncharacterized protein n=1 Tax=Lindgomyces ingoldianus TaxID=673940 RepID=A0ACB6Q8S1_9PLEO|nr:uncharacterized protein BDR25DRAFT_362999 [Lindgomyces ingoldianus]KAF2463277.1 hypothetical protein BDR25DRAFT_362999 [Lindgomyces ingoldianus]